MRIGIVCQNFPPASFEGGISHYSLMLAKALCARGHKVYALTSTEFTKDKAEKQQCHGVVVVALKGPWNWDTISEIRKTIFEKDIHAVVLQYSPASFGSSFRIRWAVSRMPCQKVTTFHTLWGGKLDRLLALPLLCGSRKIIATNSEIMFLLEKYTRLFLEKTYWVPIGSNITPPNGHQPELERSQSLISYFGMLYPGKGLDLILETLAELKRRGYPFQFMFIGGGMLDHEHYERAFRDRIASKGLGDIVEHLGLIAEADVSKWLSRSRFVFLPYESGLSDRRGSFMAAIAHGKAVLTSPPAVKMAFLKNGFNVLWPEEPAISQYVRLLEELLQNDTLIRRLEAGARVLSQHFTWSRIAKEHELVLQMRQTQG